MKKRTDHEYSADANVQRPDRSRKKKKRVLAIIGIVLLCLLLLTILALIAYNLWSTAPGVSSSGLKEQVTAEPTPGTAEQVSPSVGPSADPSSMPEVTATPEPVPVRRDNTYTLLVVGRDKVGLNTDTIMVATMDCVAGTANIVSIPRDTLVNVPWEVKKANSIYGALGIEGLVDGIEDLLGYPIDNYVVVNVYAFQQVIDCIGGVYFTVPMYMYYDDPRQNLHINLAPGYQLLNGSQAEQLVRFRQNNDGSGYGTGDLGRIETQHAFFTELARQLLSIGNIPRLPEIVNIVVGNTDTNLTSGNIAFYAEEFLKMKPEDIQFLTLPYDTVYIRGGSYISIQLQPWLEMINTYLNPFDMPVTEENLDVITFENGGFTSTTGNAPGIGSFYNYMAG